MNYKKYNPGYYLPCKLGLGLITILFVTLFFNISKAEDQAVITVYVAKKIITMDPTNPRRPP